MNKDIIYIDVDDDITAIISKVKAAREKIVALVPPKRIGVLQSAVNLRLLARSAEQGGKRLVLITGNDALMALATAAQIPTSKNLQSKPTMAEIPALEIDDGEDIIDGSQLPIGELARTADTKKAFKKPDSNDKVVDEVILENDTDNTPLSVPPKTVNSKSSKVAKVPNFNNFRKKLVLIILAALLLIGFLVWAFIFAGKAHVVITARTSDQAVSVPVTLANDFETNTSASTIKTITKKQDKEVAMEFEATGSKEVGERATGTIDLSNNSLSDRTIEAGTIFTASNGTTFSSNSSVTVPAAYLCSDGGNAAVCPGKQSVGVTASDIGEDYNVAPQSFKTSAPVNAESTQAMSGGSKKTVKIVSAKDVERAEEKLLGDNKDAMKKKLVSQFENKTVAIEDSFSADSGQVKSSITVGESAEAATPKLVGTLSYTMQGVEMTELDSFLDTILEKRLLDKADQRIYKNGTESTKFNDVNSTDTGYRANLVTTAQIGPKIEEAKIKEQAKGERYGEIQTAIEAIEGVSDVEVKFSPFWVSKAPSDIKRISVEFKLEDEK